jgi:hypothetical protein
MGHRIKMNDKAFVEKRHFEVSSEKKKDYSQSSNSPVDQILFLHRAVGNQAVKGLFKSGVIRAKHDFSQLNTKYEQEVGPAAERFMPRPETAVYRKTSPEEEEETETVQSKGEDELIQRQRAEEEEALVRTKLKNFRVQRQIEADRVTLKASRGVQAPISETSTATRGRLIHRFEGEEHEQLGNRASGNATTDLNIGGGQMLTFGEMVGMAGDWFESLSQMRTLASSANGRQQLQWARWKALGGRGTEPAVSDAVKTACMNRYYGLAAQNVSHFSAGGAALSVYKSSHREALRLAFDSGATGMPGGMDAARTAEAFGGHFLTDMFSSGHVRTPRDAQRTWYQTHYPNSIDQIVNHMAGVMHTFLVGAHPLLNRLGQIPSRRDLATQIRTLGGPALASMSLGDLVSKAYHDHDNLGLDVVSELNHYGNVVSGGFRWRAVGDNYLNSAAGYYTRTMANRSLEASLADLTTLQRAGQAARSLNLTASQLRIRFQAEVSAILVNNKYQAERYIPRVDPAGSNVAMSWQWGSFDAEMRRALDGVVKGAIARELATKSAELRSRNTRRDTYAADALDEVIRRLRTSGIGELETAIGGPAGP